MTEFRRQGDSGDSVTGSGSSYEENHFRGERTHMLYGRLICVDLQRKLVFPRTNCGGAPQSHQSHPDRCLGSDRGDERQPGVTPKGGDDR
jgi:hypothetical protein